MGLAAVIWSQWTTPKKLCQSGEQNERERVRLDPKRRHIELSRLVVWASSPHVFSRGGGKEVCVVHKRAVEMWGGGGVAWRGAFFSSPYGLSFDSLVPHHQSICTGRCARHWESRSLHGECFP